MHDPLKNCPFCGAAAHFEMDDGRWEWVECESCGMQGNRSASLMEDCKPKLAEAWNRRTPQPTQAQAGAVPLTHGEALDAFCHTPGIHQFVQAFVAGVRFAEHHHGIKGGQHDAE